MPLSFVSYEGHGKATSDGGEQNGFLASIPALGRRLFLCRFTPIHLRFRHLLLAYRTKCVSMLGASAQVDAPFSAV